MKGQVANRRLTESSRRLARVAGNPAPKVGYVLKRFPRLSETFILNEILELERQQGVEVEIFSLLGPRDEIRHELLKSLRAPVTYLPRGGGLNDWNVRAARPAEGALEVRAVRDLFEREGTPLKELFPGKEPGEACHLCMQATTLAMLSSARRIEHLHAHFVSVATTVAMLASRLSRIPYSFTAHARDIYHTYVNKRADADLRRRKIAEARFVVTVSEYNRRHLVKLAGNGSLSKIHRLYNGVDLSRFRPESPRREPGLLLAVGRLIEKKGFRYLVEACRLVKGRGCDFRCLIVGEGPERELLARQICETGLAGQVVLAGAQPQEQLVETMKRASAVVLPCLVSASGDRDGLPTVLLEALAMGLPAISTTVAGVPEIIDHGRSGLLVPPADPDRLANAIVEVLENPGLQQRLGREGRLKAERQFDLRRNVAALRDLFVHSATDAPYVMGPEHDEDRVRYDG